MWCTPYNNNTILKSRHNHYLDKREIITKRCLCINSSLYNAMYFCTYITCIYYKYFLSSS
ncbi:hypothetical protein BD560DRAFT_444321 [Blakeslea trispora]|nr:hypothetical protein BD560DRAFT_444321 [Blakeslea trispora]